MMKNHKLFAVVLLSVVYAVTPAVLIDDFLTVDHGQDFQFGIPMSGNSFVHTKQGEMLSGERDLEFWHSSDAFRGSLYAKYEFYPFYGRKLYKIGGETQNSSGSATVTLQYDGIGDEVGNLGNGRRLRSLGGNSLGLAGLGGFRVWAADDANEFTITGILRRNGQIVESNTVGAGNGSLQLRPILISFSDGALAAADSVSFQFNIRLSGTTLQDSYVSHIDTILPEPGTWLAMAGGAIFLFARRRRNSRNAS